MMTGLLLRIAENYNPGRQCLLAVSGFGSVFAKVVAVEESLGDSFAGSFEGEGVVGHFGDVFEDYGVVGGVVRGASPGEGGVAVDEAGGDGKRVDFALFEVMDDGCAGLVDVAASDGFVGEGWGAGDGAVEVVGVGGAERRDGETGLGEAGGELGVGVDYGSDGGKFAVEKRVGVEVGGGFELPVDD